MTYLSQSIDSKRVDLTRTRPMGEEQSFSAGHGWCCSLVLLYIVGGSRRAGLMDNRWERVDGRKVGMLLRWIVGYNKSGWMTKILRMPRLPKVGLGLVLGLLMQTSVIGEFWKVRLPILRILTPGPQILKNQGRIKESMKTIQLMRFYSHTGTRLGLT